MKYFYFLFLFSFIISPVSAAMIETKTVGIQIGNTSMQLTDSAHNLIYGVTADSSIGSLLLLQNSSGSDKFKIDYAGVLQTGSVPWARLSSFPSACGAGEFVTGLGSTLTCASAGSGTVSGSGTANYVPRWSSATALTNSIIYDTGTQVGIGTTDPIGTLHVTGGSTDLFVDGIAMKPGGGSWTAWSDIRLKKDIKPIANALDKLSRLRGVNFNWINPEAHGNAANLQGGFIAQEVARVFPSWVSEIEPLGKDHELIPSGEKAKAITLPNEFYGLTVEAIKELSAKILPLADAITVGKAAVGPTRQELVTMGDVLSLGTVSSNSMLALPTVEIEYLPCDAEHLRSIVFDLGDDEPYVCTQSGWFSIALE